MLKITENAISREMGQLVKVPEFGSSAPTAAWEGDEVNLEAWRLVQ